MRRFKFSDLYETLNGDVLFQENVEGGGFAVAYAGKKHAVVSAPHFLANSSYRITSLSLVIMSYISCCGNGGISLGHSELLSFPY